MQSHPIAKAFLTAPKPEPERFATLPYHGVNSVKFTNAVGVAVYGRCQILPAAGTIYLPAAQAEKAGPGPDIALWGSSTLYPQLVEGNLIDQFLLLTCPILLGKGKKLFGSTSHPVDMKLVSNDTNSKGVIMTTYEPQSG